MSNKYRVWYRRYRPEDSVYPAPVEPVYQKYTMFKELQAESIDHVLQECHISDGDYIETPQGKFYRVDFGGLEVYDSLPTEEIVVR